MPKSYKGLRRVVAEREQQERLQSGATEDRIGRCAIRVSLQGDRGKADKDGHMDRAFFSPQMQSDAAAAFFEQLGVAYDEGASAAHADIDRRASAEGSWEKREGLRQHLADAKAGKFTDLAFYKLSRMARNHADGWAIIKAFRDVGVRVWFIRDAIGDINTPAGELALNMYLTMAKQESRNIGDNVSDAIIRKWREGKPHGKAPGWLCKVNGTYQRDERGWVSYRRLVELAMQGLSFQAISRALNVEGHLSLYHKRFTHATVAGILHPSNLEKMLGTAVSWPLSQDQDNVIRIPNAWPPLITPEEAAVLRIMCSHAKERNLRKDPAANPSRYGPVHGRHLLSGIARCALCGEFFHAGSSKGSTDVERRPTYICLEGAEGNRLHDGCTKRISVFTENLDSAVMRVVGTEAEKPPLQEDERCFAGPRPPHRRTVEDLEHEATYLMAMRGNLPDWMFQQAAKRLDDERQELLRRETELVVTEAVIKTIDSLPDKQTSQRLLVKAMVKEVSYPHPLQGERCLYRAAKVTLKSGNVYLTPIYRRTYEGEHRIILVR